MIHFPTIPPNVAIYATCIGFAVAFSVSIVSLIFRPIEKMGAIKVEESLEWKPVRKETKDV
jgi:hypothetical protein